MGLYVCRLDIHKFVIPNLCLRRPPTHDRKPLHLGKGNLDCNPAKISHSSLKLMGQRIICLFNSPSAMSNEKL